MSKPKAADCAAHANEHIGTSYSAMDCQAFIEKLLSQVGISRNWTGSNAMFRDAASFKDMGSPEDCIKALGCIPVGAMLGIWSETGEPSKYQGDGKGNLGHIGIKTGTDKGAVHSSQSRGCVAQSEFKDKTIRNGGWNRVLLCLLLDYGDAIEAKLGNTLTGSVAATESAVEPAAGIQVVPSTVRKGSKGSDVVSLQRYLRAEGHDLTPDGIFGSMTEQAVESYQASHGLEVDGVVGRMTWQSLQGIAGEAQTATGTNQGSGTNTVTVRSLDANTARELLASYEHFGACVVTITDLPDAEACYLLEKYPLSESGSTEGFG